MSTPWRSFFGELLRCDADDDESHAHCYTHESTGVRYERRADCVGRGQYGCVVAYDFAACATHEAPPLGLPHTFCVKRVFREAHSEVTAIAALSPWVRGCVQATVLSHDDNLDCAEVGMPLYAGTLCSLLKRSTPGFAASVLLQLATTVGALWEAGLAYTDIKSSNVLYHQSKPGSIHVLLGDLGSIVPLRADDGTQPVGIFTFPPQRSVHERVEAGALDDGVVQPREADVVWSLGALLMAMTLGTEWVVDRVTGCALRSIAAKHGGDLSKAFARVVDDIAHEADVLRTLDGKAGVRCANAMDVSVGAWYGRDGATISAFTAALRGW